MPAAQTPIRFVAVDAGIGDQIQQRRERLGMTIKGLAERAGIDRGRLSALESGDPTVRATTVGAVRAALDRLEEEMGITDADVRAIGTTEEGLVEFVIEGTGVRATVKGPIRDLDALQAAVAKLAREMRENGADSDNP